jgi:hypothetical protein
MKLTIIASIQNTPKTALIILKYELLLTHHQGDIFPTTHHAVEA